MTADNDKPLAGKRVVVTRAREQAAELAGALREAGAEPVLLPMVGFSPPANAALFDEALRALDQFDWLIFTSQNAVQAFSQRAAELKIGLAGVAADRSRTAEQSGVRVAAVGPSTASAASRAGFRVDYVAREFRGTALAAELGERLAEKKVLLPRSSRAGEDLPAALRAQRAEVTGVIAYSTGLVKSQHAAELELLRRGEVDVVSFFSPSAFRNLVEIVGLETLRALNRRVAFAAIGKVTAAAIQEAGLNVQIVAAQASSKALVAAIEDCFAAKRRTGVPTA
ncbi:MAG TPA: uroporphyrinogen-III synthase [Candidatus Acidoferrales bacterium]|nr:uroporphyrinogen-III synthase [Candidatus Acidoferrales bacterium]